MHKTSSPLSWRNSRNHYKLAGNIDLKGIIESFTIVRNAPKGFERQTPYVLALILLSNGMKVVSQIVDSDKIEIGMKVEPCIRRIYVDGNSGLINYGTKFRVTK